MRNFSRFIYEEMRRNAKFSAKKTIFYLARDRYIVKCFTEGIWKSCIRVTDDIGVRSLTYLYVFFINRVNRIYIWHNFF